MFNIKKFIVIIVLLMATIGISGCQVQNNHYQMLIPSGTPLLGLSTFLVENGNVDYEVALGSDPLVAAFTNGDYDLICAPVNLGAKLYQAGSEYVLYQTIVWGNLYIVSHTSITSIQDLANQTITVFGKNSTPDIIVLALNEYYHLNLTIEYVDDVATANALFLANERQIIVSAEPSFSNIKTKLSAEQYYSLDLQTAYQTMTSNFSYPQAGVFVKTDKLQELSPILTKLTSAIQDITPQKLADSAITVDVSFAKMGIEVITSAVPNCHFAIVDNQKQAIEDYFNILINLGFAKQIGGMLPGEDFYG